MLLVVRVLSTVGSMCALVCRSVVVVVVSVVAVQPTSATTHTPKTTGINFFIRPFYQSIWDLSLLCEAPVPEIYE